MKRKTLAERAGETPNVARSQLPKTGFGGHRANSYRNASNTSTSSSGSSRTASRGTGLRQAQAMRQQAATAAVEPSTETDEEAEAGVMGKRKGTPIISLAPSSYDKIALRKTRTHGDLRQHYQSDDPRLQHSGSYTNRCGSREGRIREQSVLSRESSLTLRQESINYHPFRNDSLSTAFAGLSLTPQQQRNTSDLRHQPSFERTKEQASPSKIPKYTPTPSLRHTQSAQTLQTPSPLKDKSSQNGLRTPLPSAKRKPEPLPVFLTKEKLTSVPAWDTKGRLEDMVSYTGKCHN